MAKHATRAKTERKLKDAKNTAAKTGRGLVNMVTGHPERLGAAMATTAAVYYAAHKAGVDKMVAKHAKTAFIKLKDRVDLEMGRRAVEKILR